MDDSQPRTNRMKDWIRNGALCAAPAVGGPGGTEGTLHELGPLALLVAGFAGAGVWMFRRYGVRSKPDRTPADAKLAGAPTPSTGTLTGDLAGA